MKMQAIREVVISKVGPPWLTVEAARRCTASILHCAQTCQRIWCFLLRCCAQNVLSTQARVDEIFTINLIVYFSSATVVYSIKNDALICLHSFSRHHDVSNDVHHVTVHLYDEHVHFNGLNLSAHKLNNFMLFVWWVGLHKIRESWNLEREIHPKIERCLAVLKKSVILSSPVMRLAPQNFPKRKTRR